MKTRLTRALFVFMSMSALIVAGCGGGEQQTGGPEQDTAMTDTGADTAAQAEQQQVAVARLESTEGNDVRGTVTFTPVNGAVRVVANITGLSPGQHGFHVHETGDCSAPDATSAGGHYNPENHPHAAPEAQQRHVGDLGNIEADQEGVSTYERVDSVLTLSGSNSIVGKAVIVHGGQDDLSSQPSGNAGPRVACGVIEMEQRGAVQEEAATGDTALTQ